MTLLEIAFGCCIDENKNPLKMKSTPAKPVDTANRAEYQALVDSLQTYIEQENLLEEKQ